MAINKILPFATTDTGSNLLSNDQYASDADRTSGHKRGIARLQLANKHAKQTALMVAGLAEFMVRNQALDVHDGDTVSGIATKLESAISAYIDPALNPYLPLAGGHVTGSVTIDDGLDLKIKGRPANSTSMMRLTGGTSGIAVSNDAGVRNGQIIKFTQDASGNVTSTSMHNDVLTVRTGSATVLGNIIASYGDVTASRPTGKSINLRQDGDAAGSFGLLEGHGAATSWAMRWDRNSSGDIDGLAATVGTHADFNALPGKALELTGFSDFGLFRLTANNLSEVGLLTYDKGGINEQWAIQRKPDHSWTLAGRAIRAKTEPGLSRVYANTNGQTEAIIGASNGVETEAAYLTITEDAQNRGLKAYVHGQDKWLMRAENNNDGTLKRMILGEGTGPVILAQRPTGVGNEAADVQWVDTKKTEAINESKAYTDSKIVIGPSITENDLWYKVGNIMHVHHKHHVGDIQDTTFTWDISQFKFTVPPHPQLTGWDNTNLGVIPSITSCTTTLLTFRVGELQAGIQNGYVAIHLVGPTSM